MTDKVSFHENPSFAGFRGFDEAASGFVAQHARRQVQECCGFLQVEGSHDTATSPML